MLKFFTTLNESLMEQLQKHFPDARFVKAFNSVGSAFMINPQFPDGKPTMIICGNDDAAKKAVTGILDQFGWDTADMGGVGTVFNHLANPAVTGNDSWIWDIATDSTGHPVLAYATFPSTTAHPWDSAQRANATTIVQVGVALSALVVR